jgi:hypothetical protein
MGVPVNSGRAYRYTLVAIVASASLILTGCGPKDSGPASSSAAPPASASSGPTSSSPAKSPLPSAAAGQAISGDTAIGPLGDPCALLTVAEVEAGTGYKVTAVTRGPVTTGSRGPMQNCVYSTNGPSLVGPLASALGAMAGQDPTAISKAVTAAGGLVGITLTKVDTSNPGPGPTADGTQTEPGVNVRVVTGLGPYAAVITLPSGAVAMAAKDQTAIMLMVLIDGPIGGDGVESMLRSAYGKA